MQHELATERPPQTPEDEAVEAREMAKRQEEEQEDARVIAAAIAARARVGHPSTCQCLRCACAVLSAAFGQPVTFSAPLRATSRMRQMDDESHEGAASC